MRDPTLLSATLDTACSAPLSICEPAMSELAQQLISEDNCGADFRNEQPLVLQAYNGLLAYEPVYRASCLKTEADDEYCLANALGGSNNSANIYPYFTAVGLAIPSGARPTCNACLKQTMQVFAQYAVRSSSPLSQTYMKCAQIVDGSCGEDYADTTIKVGSVDDGMENGKQGGQGNGADKMAGGSLTFTFLLAGIAAMALL
jgi:hypothetical protein